MSPRAVAGRRVVVGLLVVLPLVWAWRRAVPAGSEVVNRGGIPLVADLMASALRPDLSADFLAVVLDAAGVTLVFAALGTAAALVVGLLGGLVLSDVAWGQRPPRVVRWVRVVLRGALVAVRSIHELIWALLFVSVLGLDPLVAVLAIALPFGAQTAKVFGEILDGVPPGPVRTLRATGSRPVSALAYTLFPAAAPILLSYSFYRFECAIRSAVILGVVGIGGLGQELVVSLQSRNWDQVWTLVGAVLLLSAVADLWSTRLRGDLAVVSCADWSGGKARRRRPTLPVPSGAGDGATRRSARAERSWWARGTALLAAPALAWAWVSSDVSFSGLTSPRTRDLTGRLLDDMWPPVLPPGGWPTLTGAVLDTLAMAVLAMAVAVVVTMLVGPWATRPHRGPMDEHTSLLTGLVRGFLWWASRVVLLKLRSVPPTVWAVIALLVLFPGILPGALALGIYTGGILGRLVAEAWESIDTRPRDALRVVGVRRWLASTAATTPPSVHYLVTYTLYRFEICVRETAIVGVVGAAGLGRLFAENLAIFRFPVITTLLAASFVVSVAAELAGRRLRRAFSA
ncbi:ABC transporter permease subunit [Nocardioides sp. InS609-2]|uniref:PhnE/PtxC family ABC transporter permease n=1 Tax=Nocardioides sp. InS609-2 TaxID=2760705 RepID=UPI0020BF0862|nr:ABC transporter permease subunit [Nocardioides sp. InS609-2]